MSTSNELVEQILLFYLKHAVRRTESKLMWRECLNKHCDCESLLFNVTLNPTLFSRPAVTFRGESLKPRAEEISF